MFDDIHALFLENLVVPYLHYKSIRESKNSEHSADLRAAVSVATALYHFREHLPKPHNYTDDQIKSDCPDFRILGDIANVSKHGLLDRGSPSISKASDLEEVTLSTCYKDEKGDYINCQKLVIATLSTGLEREVFEMATNVINFWGHELVKNGISKSYAPFDLPPKPEFLHVSREEASIEHNVKIFDGIRIKKNFAS